MIVSKFGGTSVGSFEAMSRSAQIIWIILTGVGLSQVLLQVRPMICFAYRLPNTANSEGLMEEMAVAIWTSHRS